MRGRFVVIEGPSGSGKTSVARAVVRRLGAAEVTTKATPIVEALRFIEASEVLPARMHTWLAAGYAVAPQVEAYRRAGVDVVCESYIFRTLATHGAMGVECLPRIDWSRAAVPDLAVYLTIDDAVRRERLDSRDRGTAKSRFHAQVDRRPDVELAIYRAHGLVEVDTTDITPEEAAARIVALLVDPALTIAQAWSEFGR